ncbi:formimidoylglutamate deiminase [Spongisporangium articulatum]|uniref:Formimidoylglutamate deiminase n=1 Tax=Spongisporangium articulatum TaxID=3362603 RepID=A0ABW8ALA0_9ACTN
MDFWCEHAWLPAGPAARVRIEVDGARLASVTVGVDPQPGDRRLPGIVLPGLADAHSHAFHRALRGRTHADGGSFWTWREGMYAVAERLQPDSYLALARACYAELALGGVTSVAEFHYLHHGPDGVPYADPNAMATALAQAAADAGVHLTLLDTCYLAGGLDSSGYLRPVGVQARFSDGSEHAWAARVAQLAERPPPGLTVGVAAHSVRAVPPAALRRVGEVGRELTPEVPVHAHVSEQPAENDACHAVHDLTPVGLLAENGLLEGPFVAVHATHLTPGDVHTLGAARATACFCPTTEQDLADGIGPARALADGHVALALGSDQHAVNDLLGEARALEMGERLASLGRGRFTPVELVDALTVAGHRACGQPHAGRLEPGARADLVAVRLDTPRTAGARPDQVVPVAGAADVDTVVSGGRLIVADGQHVLGDVGRLLSEAIEPLWEN